MNFITSVQLKWRLGVQLSETIMTHKIMKEFIQSNSNSFELILIESFCQEYTVAIGHKFNAPVINLVPAAIWGSISKWLHVPSTFSYIPDSCLKSANYMSFMKRLKNTITGIMQLYVENYAYLPKMKEVMDKHLRYDGWESRPTLEHMLHNVSLTLVNSHHAIGVPRPYLPGVIEVGGMHIKEPKYLPKVHVLSITVLHFMSSNIWVGGRNQTLLPFHLKKYLQIIKSFLKPGYFSIFLFF